MMRFWGVVILGVLLLGAGCRPSKVAEAKGERGEGVPKFWVRPGYKVTLASEKLGFARFMALDDRNPDILYLVRCWYPGMTSWKDIVTLKKENGVYKILAPFVENRLQLHGIQCKNGWVWFSQRDRITKARDTNGDGRADEIVEVVHPEQLDINSKNNFPPAAEHYWRSLLVTDDKIYTSIGDSENHTDERDTDRQKVWTFDLNGGHKELFCSGIRNTEELQFRPGTHDLYGFDHGIDAFGHSYGEELAPIFQPRVGPQNISDHNPPDELNLLQQGKFYGHPFIVGSMAPHPVYQFRKDIVQLAAETTPPIFKMPAHVAPDGWTFITSDKEFPARQVGDIYVALHGSNMAAKRKGYQIARVLFDRELGKPYGLLPVVIMVDDSGNILGRPVDVVEDRDGSLLFSGDFTDQIYRLEWIGDR